MAFTWQPRLGRVFLIWLASACLHATATAEESNLEQPLSATSEPGAILRGDPFSEGWMDEFRSGEIGVCQKAVDIFQWRNSGWGNNIDGE